MVRLLRILGLGLLLAFVALAVGLGWAHLEMRSLGGPLPSVEAVGALPLPEDAPVQVLAVDTASQPMPRRLVLDPGRDPSPQADYVMSHPSFLLRWRDGRGLLIDLGMDPAAARSFGRVLELAGASPIQPHGSAAEQLGALAREGRLGLVFTHLHTDHVQGVLSLCAARQGREVALFQTPAQVERRNFTTRPGARLLDRAACLRRFSIAGSPLAPIPGFPGVNVFYAAGHTPGSQVVIARLGGAGGARTLVFTGDAVNQVDGARYDVPKPFFYRVLMVPESDARLSEVRRLLGRLEREKGAGLVVSHDRHQLESLGLLAPLL